MEHAWIEGRWRITSWRQAYDDGRIIYPFGQALDGFIEYRDGNMSCVVTKVPRRKFSSGGQWDANDSDKAQAYNEYLTYCGRYTFDGSRITHHIELCLFPNWQGTSQSRLVERHNDDEITLTARVEDGTSEARTAMLSWRREK